MGNKPEEEDVYDVEEIVNDRITSGGKKQYLIKWVGYSHSDNTWEDAANIFSSELIKEYESKKQRVGKKAVKKAPPKKFSRHVTNEWNEKIDKVTGVYKGEKGKLTVEYLTKEGKKALSTTEEVHIKAPIKLLEFYEENLTFPDE